MSQMQLHCIYFLQVTSVISFCRKIFGSRLGDCMAVTVTTVVTRGQSNLTKSASRGAHSPVSGHPRGSKVVPLNSWGRVSY